MNRVGPLPHDPLFFHLLIPKESNLTLYLFYSIQPGFMMYFVIKVLASDDQERTFTFSVDPDHIEHGLEVLTAIASRGDKLIDVLLIHNNELTRFPVSIFDGHSFLQPIQQLQSQWEAILHSTNEQPMERGNTNELMQRAKAARQSSLTSLLESREKMQALLDWAGQTACKKQIRNHYQRLVDRYNRLIIGMRGYN